MQYPHYDPSLDNRPLTDVELEDLDRTLQALPGAMNVEMLDGYLAALLLDPQPLAARPGGDWLPAVWGGDGEDQAPFASGKQRKRVVVLVLRHLQAIASQWRADPERWEPLFSLTEAGGHEWADAEDWCVGFLEGCALHPEAWDTRFDDPVLGPVLQPLALLGGDEDTLDEATRARLADPQERAALSAGVAQAVVLLVQQQADPAAPDA